MRSRYQGVTNIVRFNWHFYALAAVGLPAGVAFGYRLGGAFIPLAWAVAGVLLLVIAASLLVSHYVYDRSGLYDLPWHFIQEGAVAGAGYGGVEQGQMAAVAGSGSVSVPDLQPGHRVLNLHAGFDEFSHSLAKRFPGIGLTVADFYDPAVHTEVSVQRARAAYPAYPGTLPVNATYLPFADDTFDRLLLFFAAHEVRGDAERGRFFREVRRVSKPDARIYVLEHPRDLPNALAYTFGVFHFYPRAEWLRTFRSAGLTLASEQKITPFVSLFTLRP